MDDIFSSLVDAPNDADRAAAMARALRRQQALGQVGMVTGDRVLGPMGKQMLDSADTQSWRYAQQDMQNKSALQRAKEAAETRDFTAGENKLDRRNALQLAMLRLSEGRADKAGAGGGKDLLSLGKQYSASGITDLDPVLSDVEATFAQYGKGDIPGLGATGLIPHGMLTGKGRDVRQKVSSLRNIVLKIRSGAAVTDPEYSRFMDEIGMKLGGSDEDVARALTSLRAMMESKKQAIYSGYDPDVVETYRSRLGEKTQPDPATANTDISKMSDEELQRIISAD